MAIMLWCKCEQNAARCICKYIRGLESIFEEEFGGLDCPKYTQNLKSHAPQD